MRFAWRLAPRADGQPFIAVDGQLEGAVLELSHWPGSRTPTELRHALSTGTALNFAACSPQRQASWTRGASLLCNNHYDTDGLCALFALLEPELALAHAPRLLAAAEAGDFFRVPTREGLALDLALGRLADAQASPLASEFAGLSAHARWELAAREGLKRLAQWLERPGELERESELYADALRRIEADLRQLERASRRQWATLDLCCFELTRDQAQAVEFPGRHALHESSRGDAVGLSVRTRAGWFHRRLWNPSGWFELPGRERQRRPALELAARELNALEGCTLAEAQAWRWQPPEGAAPELWFGSAEQTLFAEHNPGLAPSRLGAEQVDLCLMRHSLSSS